MSKSLFRRKRMGKIRGKKNSAVGRRTIHSGVLRAFRYRYRIFRERLEEAGVAKVVIVGKGKRCGSERRLVVLLGGEAPAAVDLCKLLLVQFDNHCGNPFFKKKNEKQNLLCRQVHWSLPCMNICNL